MNPSAKMTRMNLCFLQLPIAMAVIALLTACTTKPTVQQQDLDAWSGVSVEALDTHALLRKAPMFRTRTNSGTEIRNYAYGYDFEECCGEAGANKVGDFINGNDLIICSSSRIVCNNMFYIKEEKVLEYAPTGRCDTSEKIQPAARYLRPKSH